MNQFKLCPKCGVWLSDEMLLKGIDVEPIGLCLEDDDMDLNYYYFNHDVPACGTTLVVRVEELRHHLSGNLPSIKLTGGRLCDGRSYTAGTAATHRTASSPRWSNDREGRVAVLPTFQQ